MTQFGYGGRDLAAPHDAIDTAFGAASAGAEVQAAVRADIEPGHIKRLAGCEGFHLGLIRTVFAFGINGQDAAARPIADENGVVIAAREHDVIVNHDARRRSAAGVGHSRQIVEIIVGPNAPSAARNRIRRRQ